MNILLDLYKDFLDISDEEKRKARTTTVKAICRRFNITRIPDAPEKHHLAMAVDLENAYTLEGERIPRDLTVFIDSLRKRGDFEILLGPDPDTPSITLDRFALGAAHRAYSEAEHLDEVSDPLRVAVETYFVTAQVRGLVHELPVIPGGVAGYEPLARVLSLAYDQSAKGKGKERHANARPFLKQPINEIGRMLGSTCDGEMYQIIKKVQEASNMVARGETDRAKAELLGAIVYAAASYILIEEKENS